MLTAILCQFAAYGFAALNIKDVWYWCNAASHLVLWSALLYIACTTFNHKIIHAGKWTKNIALYGFCLAGNQAIDEVLLDPTKFQWNELAVVVYILIHATIKAWPYGRTK